MATSTPNLGFIKPDGSGTDSDFVDAETQINPNMDKLDTILENLRNPLRAQISRGAGFTNLNQTERLVIFTTTDYNEGGMADIPNSRITVAKPGFYEIYGKIDWPNGATDTSRKAILKMNNDTVDVTTIIDGSNFYNSASCKVRFAAELGAGDFFQLYMYHTDGTSLDLQYASLSAIRRGFSGLGT